MKTKRRKILSLVLAVCLTLGMLPIGALTVFAEKSVTTRTQILDLSADEFSQTQENTAEGWKWDADTRTLTLTNADIKVAKGSGLKLPLKNGDVTLELVGENSISSEIQAIFDTDASKFDNRLTIIGDGSLEIEATNTWYPAMEVANVTFKSGNIKSTGCILSPGNITVAGGTLTVDTTKSDEDGYNDGLYALGSIHITGGKLDVNAGRIALFVPGTGTPEPLLGLNITGGDVTLQGALTATYIGLDNGKDTVINTSGTVTLNGEGDNAIGFYAYNGNIDIKAGNIIFNNIARPTGIHKDSVRGETTIALCDYSKVNAAIAAANALNKDYYIDFTAVETAVAAVVPGKNLLEKTQSDVDAWATDINNAIAALEYKAADYSKVDEATKKANALNKADYKDFTAVDVAINAVVRGKNITEQTIVDGYAAAIESAINALEYKGADYSKIDEAIEKANALNKDDYKDFSAVEAAINAVIRDKNITEQADVDAVAKAINDAISALEKKPAAESGTITQPTEPDTNTTSPKTADNSNMVLWIALLFVSCGAVTTVTVYGKNKKKVNR